MAMQKIIAHTSIIANWYALIGEAELKSDIMLSDTVENYTALLLVRFTGQAELAESIIAVDFLEALNFKGKKQREKLQMLGDKCLLLSGLFPDIAERKCVTIDYFVSMGQNAYQQRHNLGRHNQEDELYRELNENFSPIIQVLDAMRDISNNADQSFLNWK